MATASRADNSVLAGFVGALGGACVAVAIALASEVTSVLGTALLAGVGSLLGWGISALFTSQAKAIPLAVVALAGLTAVAIPAWFPRPQEAQIDANPPGESAEESSGSAPVNSPTSSPDGATLTTPLVVPDASMSFRTVPPEDAPDDMDGLIGLAKARYGDPQRLTVKHMTYDSDPDDHYPSVVYAFTGATAIALAQAEWEWFEEGNSGDAITEPMIVGEVHCALHPQGTGYSNSECWRWDQGIALAVSGIGFPTGSESSVVAAVEDLFGAIHNAN